MKRRTFIVTAASWGAAAAWGWPVPRRSQTVWRERRELFPQGVASGDPDPHSVILWTRHPFAQGTRAPDRRGSRG